jgi:hypothetical protein
MGIRETMAAAALEVVGLGAARHGGDQPIGALYRALIADGESDRAAADMMKMSGCGLVVRGLWRRCGLVDPRLEAPYVVGSVIATIEDMAREAGAWRSAANIVASVYQPQEGDVFMLDAPVHVATLSRIVPSEALYIESKWFSVDGGQRDAGGAEFITTRVREYRSTARTLDGHALLGVVDLEALACKFGGGS